MVHEHPSISSTAAVSPLSISSTLQEPVSPTKEDLKALEQYDELRVQELEGTVDHLKLMLEQERLYYAPCLDYLAVIAASRSSSSSSSPSSEASWSPSSGGVKVADRDRVNEAWRRKLCEWCFEVADHFGMEREVVSIAMNFLDRIVAKTMKEQPGAEHHIAKRDFQLVAVTSLYLAVKLHGETDEVEMDRRRLNVDVFVELSRGFFQAETLQAMELNILFNLDWHLNPPTPLRFITSMMRLIPVWSAEQYQEHYPSFRTVFKAIFDIAMYLTELSVCVSTFTFHSKNSIVAYAAILCAMDALEESLPVPYDMRVSFVNQVAEATGLMPESEKVRAVRNLLTELCPAIQERDVESLIMMGGFDEADYDGEEDEDDDEAGKSSPVCVSRVVPDELAGRNKRFRF